MRRDRDCDRIARDFYRRVFGPGAECIVEDLVLFEVIREWGNGVEIEISRSEFHCRMLRLTEIFCPAVR